MELLEQLNESQRQAVVYNEGPSLVIAGAGSGKTRVLTYKIAYLLQQGMKPWNILALTFTNKAAREMRDRIGRLVGEETARYLVMGTFHSIFARILRYEAEHIGFSSNFTIYDETDSRSLLKSIIKEMNLDDKVYKPASVHNRISMAKNHLIMAEDYAQDHTAIRSDIESKVPMISQIYLAYARRCKQANAMDFDDLLTLTYILFRDNEDIRRKYAEKFQYILVDEYQDTNAVQQRIVLQLAEHQRVCVVGDDAQSIYGFRGANIDNILDFQQKFVGTKLFKLEQNYRSTQRIVQAANSLIKHNERQIHKEVYSRNDEGEKLTLKVAYSDKEEANIVCSDIKRIKRNDGCQWTDFAILYRTNAQSRSFEELMRKEGIPYRIYGGLSFYQRKEIKDIIAYFRVVANPNDEEAVKRIINYPTRGIGQTTITKIGETAQREGVSLWEVICDPAKHKLEVSKGTMSKLEAFRLLMQSFMVRLPNDDAYVLGAAIIQEAGISQDLYSEKTPEAIARQENLEEFLSGMQDFVDSRREEDRGNEVALTDFLQEVALLTDLDSEDGEEEEDAGRVTLMTIHSAKGLEFPTVFVVGMEENIFPSPMSCYSKRELEEERRLLYVAITRAEKHCILTCAKNRYRYGKLEFNPESRFLKDIDPSLMNVQGASSLGSSRSFEPRQQNFRPVATQFKADPKPRIVPHRVEPSGNITGHPVTALKEGSVIEHERFGLGTVLKIEGSGENTKATVEFKNLGTKQLLLKFARFSVVK